MTDNRTAETLQTMSHAVIIGAGILYLFGFIVVSVFDASYGVADFSLFRTKVIEVGAVFLCFVALAMLLTFRTFSIFGLSTQQSVSSGVPVKPENEMFMVTLSALLLPYGCLGLAFLVGMFLKNPIVAGSAGFGFVLVPTLVIAALGVIGNRHFNTHPTWFVVAAAVNTAALFIILYRYTFRTSFWMVVWLSLVCLFTTVVAFMLRQPVLLRKTEWERILFVVVPAVFGLYATKVYPNVLHQYGGGAPVPIILHLNKKVSVFDSETVPVSLLDETEQGYYVLRDSDKAVFITRALVEEVEFLRPEQAVSATPKSRP